jgi:hypothetical protein
MSIENIVRPFQTPNVSPARPYFVGGKAGVPNVVLQCGRNGGGKVFNASFSASETFYMTKYNNEQTTAEFGVTF